MCWDNIMHQDWGRCSGQLLDSWWSHNFQNLAFSFFSSIHPVPQHTIFVPLIPFPIVSLNPNWAYNILWFSLSQMYPRLEMVSNSSVQYLVSLNLGQGWGVGRRTSVDFGTHSQIRIVKVFWVLSSLPLASLANGSTL